MRGESRAIVGISDARAVLRADLSPAAPAPPLQPDHVARPVPRRAVATLRAGGSAVAPRLGASRLRGLGCWVKLGLDGRSR